VRQPRRRATTLVELVVLLAVGSLALAVGFLAIQRLVNHRTGAVPQTQRRAQRAILTAQVMEVLLRDVRSAQRAPEDTGAGYVIERWAEGPAGIQNELVSWRVEGPRVIREVAGERPRIYDFEGLLEAAEPALQLRLDPVEDVLFEPDAPF